MSYDPGAYANELKLQRRVVRDKIVLDSLKMERLQKILKKKEAKKIAEGRSMAPDEKRITRVGEPVATFKLPLRSTKVLPKIVPKEPVAMPFKDEDGKLHELRKKDLLMTTVAQTVGRLKNQRERIRIFENKRNHTRTFPNEVTPVSLLPNRYQRGELPCTIEHGANGQYLSWACPLENLDYDYYLPLYFDGLQVGQKPVSFVARQGIEDLLFAAQGHPERIIPSIKQLMRPIRNALVKYDKDITLATIKAIRQLLECNEGIGELFVPNCKIILGPMAVYMEEHKNLGDGIDYGQRRHDDLGEEIKATLELLESRGGPKALSTIKFCVPLYESCVRGVDRTMPTAMAGDAGITVV